MSAVFEKMGWNGRLQHGGAWVSGDERFTAMGDFTFIDLFAGLGGFHVGLARLGGKAVFASEWVAPLAKLYEANFSLMPAGDITMVRPSAIPDHDLLAAGFPCQPFSKAGEQLGFEHTEQGQLFFRVEEILREKRPQHFILENVPNLLRHRGGATIARIEADLRALNYDVRIGRFSPHQFGIPQVRDRVYIVGSQSSLSEFEWPEPSPGTTDVRSVLSPEPADAKVLSESTVACLEAWDDFLSASPRDVQIPSFPIWSMEFGADYPYESETPFALVSELGSRGLSRFHGSFGQSLFGMTAEEQLRALPSHGRRPVFEFPKWKIDFIRQNRKFYEDNRKWIDPWLPRVQTFSSSYQKFEWNAKGEEKTVWNYVVQMRASGVRIKRPTTAPSLIAMTETQVPIIAWERRYMTPRECAALQSLESIALPDKSKDAYRALGNAVNAKVVERIVASLLQASSQASAEDRDQTRDAA